MSIQLMEQLLTTNSLSVELAEKYLTLYLGDAQWQEKISQLWSVQSKKLGEEKAKEFVKKSVACACLSPVINKSAIPEENHVLLFWVSGWPQFNERDWFSLFKDVVKNDIQVEKNRSIILNEGIFEHIDIPPLTRQAFNWLYEKLEKESFVSEERKNEAVTKMKNLVRIYGGAVICNLFTNYSLNIDKVLNWRSGYFIEKEIHKVYSVEQIIKIKKAEMLKTNSNYIKKVNG
jgi:hypothetical protein